MEQNNKIGETLWELAIPFLLYALLNMALETGLELYFPSLFSNRAQEVWKLALVNTIEIPIFYKIYRRNQIRELLTPEEKSMPPKRKLSAGRVLSALLTGLFLSRGCNFLLGLTPLPELFSGYKSATEGIYGASLAAKLAASVVTAPILEELLVRGILYRSLKRALENRCAAMICASILFGILHGNVVQGLYACVIGFYLNLLYETYDSLLLAIGVHGAINALTIFIGKR